MGDKKSVLTLTEIVERLEKCNYHEDVGVMGARWLYEDPAFLELKRPAQQDKWLREIPLRCSTTDEPCSRGEGVVKKRLED